MPALTRAGQLERWRTVQSGGTVLANVRKGHDQALITWAEELSCYIYIGDRENHTAHKRSIWYNPFKVAIWGRTQALRLYRDYILKHPDLLARLPELRGTVLGCWCYPQLCHGSVLIELLAERN
jgi:uncharacterized protein DUF4326